MASFFNLNFDYSLCKFNKDILIEFLLKFLFNTHFYKNLY